MNDLLARYMSLHYPIELIRDPDGGYVAEHPDLPGCFAQGESANEAVDALEVSRRLWFEARLEQGLPIPDPPEEGEYSGRFVLRVPRTVHGELARRASRDGVSLNLYVSTALARHLGAAPIQEFTERMTRRLEEILVDLQIAAKRSTGQVSTAVVWDAFNTASLGIWAGAEDSSDVVQMTPRKSERMFTYFQDALLPAFSKKQYGQATIRRLTTELK
jgi:antitoxin HicB